MNRIKWRALDPTIFLVCCLLLFIISSMVSCKTVKYTSDSIVGLKHTVDYLPGYNPYQDTVYYKLTMSQDSYKHLRGYHRGKRLVAQVYFPQVSSKGSPTLIVYRRSIHHKPLAISPVILTYGMPSSDKVKANGLALGNLLLKIKELDKLIKSAKEKNLPIGPFIFTPFADTTNPHMSYRVSLEGSDEYVTFNPSPPG